MAKVGPGPSLHTRIICVESSVSLEYRGWSGQSGNSLLLLRIHPVHFWQTHRLKIPLSQGHLPAWKPSAATLGPIFLNALHFPEVDSLSAKQRGHQFRTYLGRLPCLSFSHHMSALPWALIQALPVSQTPSSLWTSQHTKTPFLQGPLLLWRSWSYINSLLRDLNMRPFS